jgi:glutamine synthetase
MKRLDLRETGRTLFGDVPPKNQQFSDHYYGKIPHEIE